MNKLMTVVAASVCAVSFAAEEAKQSEELEQEETKLFEAGVDLDLNTAYIWRNVVQTDKPVFQPCVWLDFTGLEDFKFGVWYWQGWDLSSDRREYYHRRLNESDFNVHAGWTAWKNEDESSSLYFEFGHEWYSYHFDRREDGSSVSPTTREFYLKAVFENPIVGVYGQTSWLYDNIGEIERGWYYELGFNKEIDLATCELFSLDKETLVFGLDWNLSFGDDAYLRYLLGDVNSGFAGTTAKAYLTWNITDWMALTGTIAYTGLLNPEAREQYGADGMRDERDCLWGGFRLSFSY